MLQCCMQTDIQEAMIHQRTTVTDKDDLEGQTWWFWRGLDASGYDGWELPGDDGMYVTSKN